MQSAIPPRLILAGRLVAIAGVLLAALFAVVGLDGYEAYLRPPVAIWIALPLPLGYWAGRKLARSAAAFATVVAGLAVAFLVAAWAYWEITWGVA
jgi:hypothetical protein